MLNVGRAVLRGGWALRRHSCSGAELPVLSTSLVQREAPDFSLKGVVDGELATVTPQSLLGSRHKYLLLLFYPLDFTFVCPTELTAYADRLAEFHGEGCAVAGVSVDSEYSHLVWTRMKRSEGGLHGGKGPFALPLVSDLGKTLSRQFGVLNAGGSVALRAQALIDGRRIVRHLSINDLGIGRSVDESLRLLQAVKFVDEHGEACPADWKPGASSIKPDVQGAQAYFSKLK